MFGSGCFNYSYDEAVAYFIGMLTHIGIPKEELYFTVPDNTPFYNAVTACEIEKTKIFTLTENGDFWCNWKFGKCGLLGCGITAIHVPRHIRIDSIEDLANQPDVCIEIGNLIHIFGKANEHEEVENIPNPGFEVGIGSARLAIILKGKSLWELPSFVDLLDETALALNLHAGKKCEDGTVRIITDHLRTISSLIINGILPGTKRESFILRKMIREYCEYVWVTSQKISDTSNVTKSFMRVFSVDSGDTVTEIIAHEEKRFCATLERGAQVLKKGTCTDPDELMNTYGVRMSLIPILGTIA
jgi:alanyl-tRNA synthetase